MKQRKNRSDSVNGLINKIHAKKDVIAVPKGESLRSNAEKDLWDQYTAARPADAWREIDLLDIVEMIHLKILMRDQLKEIKRLGVMIDGKYGPQENPSIASLRQTKRLHLAIKSSMSLGISGNAAVALNGDGKTALEKAIEHEQNAQISLLAH